LVGTRKKYTRAILIGEELDVTGWLVIIFHEFGTKYLDGLKYQVVIGLTPIIL